MIYRIHKSKKERPARRILARLIHPVSLSVSLEHRIHLLVNSVSEGH